MRVYTSKFHQVIALLVVCSLLAYACYIQRLYVKSVWKGSHNQLPG